MGLSNDIHLLLQVLLNPVQFSPLRLLVIIVEVEDHPIPFKLEHLLHIQTIHHPLDVDEELSLLALRLELSSTD